MAEKALALLPAVREAAKLGAVGVEQARKIISETLKKAFPDYDMEKVFWQAVYGDAIFIIGSWAYRFWAEATIITKKPELFVEEFFESLKKVPIALPWSPLGSLLMPTLPIGDLIMRAILGNEEFERMKKEQAEELRRKRDAALQEVGIPPILDRIMTEYSGYVLMGIPAFFVFREYREYKKRKETFALAST